MGPLGVPETIFIFVLALLLFGPKKLPELGRTLGKALTEFRRAQSELKATFDREMKSLEREHEAVKEVTNSYYHDSYNYDYSSYDSGTYNAESHDTTATTTPQIAGASATQGAESTPATLQVSGSAPAGTVANGSYPETGMLNGHPHESAPGQVPVHEHLPNTSAAEQTPVKT